MQVNVSSVKQGIIWMEQVSYVVCVKLNSKVVYIVLLMEVHATFVTLVTTYH